MQVTHDAQDLAVGSLPGLEFFDPVPDSSPRAPGSGGSSVNGHHGSPAPAALKHEPSGDAEHTAKPAKPKQKRNKPTLSCLECVERKTKCDRGRPCLACIKRQSNCEYTAVANLIASAGSKNGQSSKARCVTKPPNKMRKTSTSSAVVTSPTVASDNGWTQIDSELQRKSSSSHGSSPFMLSNPPYSHSSPSNVFGVGSQHPFSNYWTCEGGLAEVISVLPSKDQADILIATYFEAVDPVLPFMHRRSFYTDYERFWALPADKKNLMDASFLALHYAMYALGTQFMSFPSYEERSQTAEFYCSAANQALRLYSYLNRTCMRAIQAMLLMSYFLMNDNHASDAYAWAGIHLRQAYALRLHRDPEVVVSDAPVLQKQQRRKLWQAVFLHDTLLTAVLKLPPTATHSDVPVESLTDENELSMDGLDTCLMSQSRVENLMSINVIAPQACEPLDPPQPHHIVDQATMKSDVHYMRCMWHLGNLVQENISSPSSLSLPIANSPRHRDSIIAAFKRLHKSFPAHLTNLDYASLQQQASLHPRTARQNLFLTSNYYHCLMIVHATENDAAGVECSTRLALEAAHEAIWAFFKLWGLFEREAGVWWIMQHRAFEESRLIAQLLTAHPPPLDVDGTASIDPIYAKARGDVVRMIDLLSRYGGNVKMHETRREVLQEALSRIAF
ncbi:Fungal specific transcription factor domain [Teratosphaeria destructans]|uniref:Fungal specific transcription factor domain n=1 Tax=Teratosphaeria destructans TaxID=418781 RepID=A0A9W7VYN3_9PEZI|nr:Fungal specific transcription factor domain [Teratosphaeria destructans]